MKFVPHSNCKTNKDKLGNIGEQIVAHYVGGTLSENKYDPKKDLILHNAVACEVKTQCRHITKNVFSIRAPTVNRYKNQIVKCENVEKLYFVEYNNSDKFRIYECKDRENTISYQAYMGDKLGVANMIGWPIEDMDLILEVEDPYTCAQMRSYSQSKTLMKDFPK
jgi:hypothetical protein